MLILDYGSTHFKNKVVLTKFINPCRMVWDSIWGTSFFYESKSDEAKRGGMSAIWPILCCRLFITVQWYSSILHGMPLFLRKFYLLILKIKMCLKYFLVKIPKSSHCETRNVLDANIFLGSIWRHRSKNLRVLLHFEFKPNLSKFLP